MPVRAPQHYQRFEDVYKGLNAHQQEAVNHTEGPVMVIAGPGTGKTQILACRIGKILYESDFLPQNILCLTYTDAGTVAMRERLLDFIGPGAYKVNIHTFHSFCNEVIQDNLHVFEKNTLDLISDLEKIQLFKELIDQLPKNNPLKRYRGDVYFDIQNLASLFSTMKREGWTPHFLKERIESWVNDLPSTEGFYYKNNSKNNVKGDPIKAKIEEELEKMERTAAAVELFEEYQQMMAKKHRYDFDDMINWVIHAWETNTNLLAEYQERFQYILVDEFQDTSGTQNKLIELLASNVDNPNIFVVGDDDQSIYRFQGANIENMANFANSFSTTLRTIVLTENYRSVKNIIDVSTAVIKHNGPSRLVNRLPGLSKDVQASNEKLKLLNIPPNIRQYNTQAEEMIGITMEIRDLVKQGVPPGNIAVIYRENKYGSELAQYFHQLKVPYYVKRNINLFDVPFARKILQILRYVAAELDTPYSGEGLLFEIMHYDFYNIPPIETARVSIEVAEKGYKEKSAIRKYLQEWIHTKNLTLFSLSPPSEMLALGKLIEQWIGDAHNITLQQLFSEIVNDGGILAYVMKSPRKIYLVRIVQTLFDFIKEETHRHPNMTITTLMETIDLMIDNGIQLTMPQELSNDKGVHLLTAHGAKGLEFEYVYLVGTNNHLWEKTQKRHKGFTLPKNVFGTSSTFNDEDELRRLFYVAITRAEKYLYISYPVARSNGKPLEPSMFIAEITDQFKLPQQKIELPVEQVFDFQIMQFNKELLPEIEKVDQLFVDALLQNFVMNVTALNNYLRCPLEFYYQNLIRVPSGKSENTEFGSAIHYAIEKLFSKMQESGKNIFPSKEEFIRDFKYSMLRNRESFTQSSLDRRMEYGQDILANYYDKYVHSWNTVVSVERNVRNVVVNGVPLKGKIDKLEFEGRFVNVVDYKTGDYENAIKKYKKCERPNESNPHGGDYWRQAVFYKILLDNYKIKNWQVISTEFDFIEPNKQKEYHKEKVIIEPADITTVTQQIMDTWQKIQRREFYVGCGKEDCRWCNFVKDNRLHVKLHEAMETGYE